MQFFTLTHLALFFVCCATVNTSGWAQPLIALAPAGHAKQTGRTLGASYERTQAYNLAQALGKELHTQHHLTYLITREPGQEIDGLHHAAQANQAGAALFISIHMYRLYQQQAVRPVVNLYHLVLHPLAGQLTPHHASISTFVPYHQVHLPHASTSKRCADAIYTHLHQTASSAQLLCTSPLGMPCKPLLGINCPAIALELGVQHDTDWQDLVEILAAAIAQGARF